MLCLNEEETLQGERSVKAQLLKEMKTESPTQQELVHEYLSKGDRSEKVDECIENLSMNVLNEMMLSSSLASQRQYFSLFFRAKVAFIREEMYAEFKDYIDDTSFDLYMRKGLMHYEGV